MPEDRLRMKWLSWPVTALGPGRRVALWVAGCSLGCPGCITPELQPAGSGRELPVGRIAERVLGIAEELDGITLTGGEPFEQAGALAELLDILLAERREWSVLAYSGYPLRHLSRMGSESAALLARTDILVAGPYAGGRPIEHRLAGSGNQQVQALSALGRRLLAAGDPQPREQANLAVGQSGADLLIGIFSSATRARLHRSLGLSVRENRHG